MAAFEDGRMMRRESRATDREGGRDWMLAQIRAIAARMARRERRFDRCGIGFGGPVDFADAARRALHARRRLAGFRACRLGARDLLGVPAVMDNDANVGALGEGVLRRRRRAARRCST